MAALEQAITDKADIAEIDVQQLKDGTLIVMHDAGFKRTTGMDLPVWEADYEQVKNLDAGSYFSYEFAGEPVPTLEDMLAAAKGRIQLMIELKPTGYEQNMVEGVLALIEKNENAEAVHDRLYESRAPPAGQGIGTRNANGIYFCAVAVRTI